MLLTGLYYENKDHPHYTLLRYRMCSISPTSQDNGLNLSNASMTWRFKYIPMKYSDSFKLFKVKKLNVHVGNE